MPHLRAEPVVETPAPTPVVETPVAAPVPVQEVVSEPPAAAADAAHPDEDSGVRHVLVLNQPGILREVCSPVVFNRCS
jgi:hypothetical protein